MHLKSIQRTQQFQSQSLQEILAKTVKPVQYRRLFQAGGDPPSEFNPLMLAPYLSVMTDEQNNRYRRRLMAKQHEEFSLAEVRELEKNLAANEWR